MISHSMSRLTLLALLVAGLVVWVPACGQEGNDAYKAIQGNWQPTEWTSDGEPRFKDDLKDRRLIFTGQEVRLVLRGFGEEDGQAKGFPIRLDPSKKPGWAVAAAVATVVGLGKAGTVYAELPAAPPPSAPLPKPPP